MCVCESGCVCSLFGCRGVRVCESVCGQNRMEQKIHIQKEPNPEQQPPRYKKTLRTGALTAKLKVEFHTILGCSIRF